MKKQIYDEKTGLMYELKGDYYYPMLEAPMIDMKAIGMWGYRRFRYLRDFKRAIFSGMLMSDTLESHLIETNRQTEEIYSQLVKQYAENEGVTEELKRLDQMTWIGAMNNIRNRVTKVINNELIFA